MCLFISRFCWCTYWKPLPLLVFCIYVVSKNSDDNNTTKKELKEVKKELKKVKK